MICYAYRPSWDGKRKGRITLIYLENPFPDNLEHGALRTTTFLAATGVTAHWEVHIVNIVHYKSLQHKLGWEVTEKYTLWTLLIQEYDANEITRPKILTAHTAVTTNWEVHIENITHWEHCKFRNVTPMKLQTKNPNQHTWFSSMQNTSLNKLDIDKGSGMDPQWHLCCMRQGLALVPVMLQLLTSWHSPWPVFS